TLTVYGQSFLSSVTVTGQFLISTIPGQPALPLDSAQISSLKVQTSTLNLVDTTTATSVLPLYNQGGSLYFNGSAVGGGGGSVGSNYAFSNLRVTDTLSSISTFTEFLSAGQLQVSTLYLADTLNTASILPLYNENNSLYFNGVQLAAATIGSNFGFINLNIIDTLSTSSTFTNYVSTAHLDVAGITQRKGTESIYLGSNRTSTYRANSVWYDNTKQELFVAGLGTYPGTNLVKTTNGASILQIPTSFESNVNYVSYPYKILETNVVFNGSNLNDNTQILMASGLVDTQNANKFFLVATDGFTLAPPSGTQSILSNVRCATAYKLSNTSLLLIGGAAKPNHTSIQYSTDFGANWADVFTAEQTETFAIGTESGHDRMIAVGCVAKKPGSL
ncbi:MAG: hypothetical protein EBU08_21815, partial [Micrococcales bacterium]|nr:hypothetical protein [Micrococcales bacterium]